jgi:hypothetical protein
MLVDEIEQIRDRLAAPHCCRFVFGSGHWQIGIPEEKEVAIGRIYNMRSALY